VTRCGVQTGNSIHLTHNYTSIALSLLCALHFSLQRTLSLNILHSVAVAKLRIPTISSSAHVVIDHQTTNTWPQLTISTDCKENSDSTNTSYDVTSHVRCRGKFAYRAVTEFLLVPLFRLSGLMSRNVESSLPKTNSKWPCH
jgi:hypothetical protein